MDASITPGDDFFAYANGAWLKATAIPAGKERWAGRDELEDVTRRRIAALLDAASAAPAGSAARKVADFRAAYLNEAAIEARGLASLQPLLDRVEKVSDKAELTRLLGRGMRADVDPLGFGVYKSAGVLGLSVEQSIHGEKTNIAFLVQGGLGLPDREDYLSADPGKEALRARYREYIRTMLTLAGFDRADERASAVLALETAIAQSQATREASANDRNADNVWTRSDFARRAPGMDWTVFFDAAGLAGQEEFVVWQPTAVTGLAAQVASQPLEAWKDYLRFHAIHDFADVLPRAFAEQALALRAATGAGPQPSRAERALAATQVGHEECAGEDVRRALFPRRAEGARGANLRQRPRGAHEAGRGRDVDVAGHQGERVVEAADAVRGARVSRSMGGRFLADRGPGRPAGQPAARLRPRLPQCRRPTRPARRPEVLVHRLRRRSARSSCSSRTRTSCRPRCWSLPSTITRHPTPRPTAPSGRSSDTISRTTSTCWAPTTTRSTACGTGGPPRTCSASRLSRSRWSDQFSAYQPLPGLSINGKLTLTENIADLGGLAAAFDAYRKTLGSRVTDADYVREQDREFFIAYAQTLRRKISEGAAANAGGHRATTRRRTTGPTRFAISMPGTTRSTCARGSGCTSSPRRACGSGSRLQSLAASRRPRRAVIRRLRSG